MILFWDLFPLNTRTLNVDYTICNKTAVSCYHVQENILLPHLFYIIKYLNRWEGSTISATVQAMIDNGINTILENLRVAQSFIESELPLPCWQCLQFDPILNQLNPVHILKINFFTISLILSSHPRMDLQLGLFLSRLPTKISCASLISSIRTSYLVHLILLDLTTLMILIKNAHYEAHNKAIFSTLLLHSLSLFSS
jgi:hypothetical protein